MTTKLYYQSAQIYKFNAIIREIRPEKTHYIVILDQSAFFPEGGGQPGDTGWIENAEVFDTQIQKGEILHFVRDPQGLAANQTVRCSLDRKKRFARMQAHSGEHVVSGLAYTIFHANNVGFHMDDDCLMTVDFDRYLTKEQLSELEICANETVWLNKNIRTFFPDPDEIEHLTFRSKADAYENLRLVEIEGCDLCACCAPHVSQTGEIGLIKILSGVSHRGGIRITLICGRTAFEDYQTKYRTCLSAAALLKVPHNAVDDGVSSLLNRNEALRAAVVAAECKMIESILSSISSCEKNLAVITDDLSSDALRLLTEQGKEKCQGIFLVICGNDESGYRFGMSSKVCNVQASVKDMTLHLKGKGGGRDSFAQGTVFAARPDIEQYLSSHNYLFAGV